VVRRTALSARLMAGAVIWGESCELLGLEQFPFFHEQREALVLQFRIRHDNGNCILHKTRSSPASGARLHPYRGFPPSRIGSVSTSTSDFTMCCVPALYFTKCGVFRCASYAA
jgi:hypothetical protein